MAGLDLFVADKEDRALQRVQCEKQRRDQAIEEPGPSSFAVLASSSSSNSKDEPDNDEDAPVLLNLPSAPLDLHPSKRAEINIVTPSLAAALDRTKLSDRKAAFVLTETAKRLRHDVKELNIINCSSIHRQRESYRVNLASSVQDKFDPIV